MSISTVGCDCRIHRWHLCSKVRPFHNECPIYDTKQSDGEALVLLYLWGMLSTSSLPSLSGPFKPRVAAPARVLSMSQIEDCLTCKQNATKNRLK